MRRESLSMIEAELADGTVLEFPDDTPEDVVKATVKRMIAQGQQNAFSSGGETMQREQIPPDVPISDGRGVDFTGPDAQPSDFTAAETAQGFGETALSIATGATGGTLGTVGGTIEGLVDAIRSGKIGTQEGVKMVEDAAMERAQQFTYQPRGEAGREFARETGEFLAPAQALAPLTGELSAISQSARATAPLGARSGQVARQAQQTVQAGEKARVPVMTSDVFPPRTFAGKTGQAITERIPFVGTGPVRAAQYQKRLDAVRGLLDDYGVPEATNVIDDVMRNLSKKRTENINRYSGMKNKVIQRNADRGQVPVDKTINTIDQEIAKLKGLKSQDVQPAINILEDYKNAFSGQTLDNVELLRKQLGERFSAQDLASVKGTAEKSINNIYRSVRDDMGESIKSQGDRRDFNAWNVANKRLSNMMGELKNSTLKSVLAKGEATPEQARRLLFSSKPSDVKTLKKNLSEAGRSKAKVAILQEAVEKAGGLDNLTTEKFLNKLSKLDTQVGEFFTTPDKQAISGLVKALNATRRASEASAKPPTGAELTAFAAPTGISYMFGVDPMTGLGATASIGALARLYESKPIRNLLIRIGRAKESSGPKVNDLVDQLTNMPQYKAFVAAQAENTQEEQ